VKARTKINKQWTLRVKKKIIINNKNIFLNQGQQVELCQFILPTQSKTKLRIFCQRANQLV